MPVHLLAGLGNPGPEYAQTRHNLGWQCITALGERLGASWREDSKFSCRLAQVKFRGRTLRLALPTTYMNESGRCIGPLMRYFRLSPDQLAVAFDDITLPIGRLKIATRGSAGGHNGVSSVLQHAGDGFVRLKLGIGGKPHAETALRDWVLGKFNAEEQATVDQALPDWMTALQTLLQHGPETAMNRHNTRAKPLAPEPNPTTTTSASTP